MSTTTKARLRGRGWPANDPQFFPRRNGLSSGDRALTNLPNRVVNPEWIGHAQRALGIIVPLAIHEKSAGKGDSASA